MRMAVGDVHLFFDVVLSNQPKETR